MDQSEPPVATVCKEPEALPRKQSFVLVALKKVKTNLSLTDKGSTPVNWKLIWLVFLSLFSSSFTITFLFPFLPEMILSFGYAEVDKGYYAGIVASAMFAGRAVGSYFWGWLSDVKGRKPVMLITILLNGVASLAFGFTTNIYFAIVTRFLTGLVNGTVGTAKSVLYEISDNTNQAVGMSIISVAWGMGMILGPTVGGYLANPCKRYPELFASEGLFYDFPYLLPSIFPFVLCIIATFVDFIWLPETLEKKNKKEIIDMADDCENAEDERTSLHSVHSLAGHRRRLAGPAIALSVENLHVESEGATYLAGAGKELHVSRHGITVTDVQDSETHHSHTAAHSSSNEHLHNTDIKSSHNYSKSFFLPEEDELDLNKEILDKKHENHNTCTHKTSEVSSLLSHKSAAMTTEEDGVQLSQVKKRKVNRDVSETGTSCGLSSCCCYICRGILNWGPVKLLRQYEVFLAITMYSAFSFGVVGFEEIFTVWAATDIQFDGLGLEPDDIGAVLGISSIPLLFLQLFLFPNLIRRLGVKKTFIVCAVIQLVLTTSMPTLHLLINQFVSPLFGGSIYSWTVGYASDNIGPPFDVSFIFFLFGLVYWACAILGVFVPESLDKQKK